MALFSRHKPLRAQEVKPFFTSDDLVSLGTGEVTCRGRVKDVDGASITLTCTDTGSRSLVISRGDTLEICSASRSGLRRFRGQVTEVQTGLCGSVKLMLFEDLGKVQRREFARAPGTMPIQYRVIDSSGPSREDVVEATTRDIGGGGMLVLVDRESRPSAGDTLEVLVSLSATQVSSARAQVLRVDPVPQAHDQIYVMALRFTEIDEQARDLIVRCVFARQTELHRAGLL